VLDTNNTLDFPNLAGTVPAKSFDRLPLAVGKNSLSAVVHFEPERVPLVARAVKRDQVLSLYPLHCAS
jgi:hypothetical protein